ncbi:hypothetical protein EON66_06890, partial [archaeon]
GQWPRAEADFKRALQLVPEQPYVLNYLGYTWVERGENLAEARGMLERAMAGADVEAIMAELSAAAAQGSKVASNAVSALSKMSPTSLKVTLEQMRRGARLSLAECFQMEVRMALRFMQSHDFYEGVRSVLVDKDGAPKWVPATLADVPAAAVNMYFEPLPASVELKLQ